MTEWGRTKIVATLGPASASEDQIRALIRAGADCFRINFSHGDGESLTALAEAARAAARAEGKPLPLLADVQGPKLRVGKLPPEGALLVEGSPFVLTVEPVAGSAERVHLPHEELLGDIGPGAHIYLADGSIRLRAESVNDGEIHTRVVTGGRLFSHKGVNLPGLALSSIPTLTAKDQKDLAFIGRSGLFDMLAVSFVRAAKDLHQARALLGEQKITVMAKIERPEALENLEAVLVASDGIMLARGDLGVELPLERVPLIQKEVLARAAQMGKWTLVATQMLGSMVSSPRPTRAEASDVANAIFDGADAVMLSEETATGDYPEKAVATMARIAHEVERSSVTSIFRPKVETVGFAGGAAGAAVLAAQRLQAKAVVALAGSGLTALLVSKQRPALPVVALSANEGTLHRLNVLWGVVPLPIPEKASAEEQIATAEKFLKERKWAQTGDTLVIVGALPLGEGRETNTIRFHQVGEKA